MWDTLQTEYGSLQAVLQEKEELVSDLQDTVHSLQRGEACLDVSLTFNEPMPLNASFTERVSCSTCMPVCFCADTLF